jgi:hypothetical protein
MSDGYTHYQYYKKGRIIFVVAMVTSIATALFFVTIPHIWMMPGFIGLTFLQYLVWPPYVDPDLDQIGITAADGRMIRQIPVFGYLFSLWWTMYAYVMNILCLITGTSKGKLGAHRSILTHSYPGTLIRVFWLNVPIGVPVTWFAIPIPSQYIFIYLSSQTIALLVADKIHYSLDGLCAPLWFVGKPKEGDYEEYN